MKTRKNIDILDKAPSVSKEEVESYMDFDAVLNEYNKTKATTGDSIYKRGLISLGVVILIGVTIYYFLPEEGSSISNNPTEVSELKEVAVTENAIEAKTETIISEKPTSRNPIAIQEIIPKKKREEVIPKTENKKQQATDETKEEVITEAPYVYVEAVPVEGLSYLYAYFHESLTYPNELRKDSIEGVVLIRFSILKDSTVSNVEIVQSLGEKFDNEAIRVISNMPKWIPATVNSTPVSSKLSIPLTFNIKK